MIDTSKTVVRFAPSPTGFLHIGNLRPALFNWLFALQNGGEFILRLDDTDTERSKAEYAQAIERDLSWIGIDAHRKARQSDRIASYDAAAARLREAGLLYACYETPDEIERRRKRLMARGLPPVYDRAALRLNEADKAALEAEGRKPHWRFLLPNFDGDPFATRRTQVHFTDLIRGEQTVDLASMSDPVLIRADGSYLYTLPSVVDDADMGVSHVIRGGDHITNTGVQTALFKALGVDIPDFGHHNLLQDASGAGLSKRIGSFSLASLRDEGFEAMAVASLAALTGSSRSVTACASMSELADRFDMTGASRSDARFDAIELQSLNERLLHEMPYGLATERLKAIDADLGEPFWLAVRPNLEKFSDVEEWARIVRGDFEPIAQDQEDETFLSRAKELLPPQPWSDTVWQDWTTDLKSSTGRKGRALFMPLRMALTGQQHGPELAALLPLIGWEETVRRLP
ncbi:MAG: glutamate--tRNA ligase [Ahrensia sp.]|nr:glutamate--tRNA ligase [Ahrensia sp.]